MSDLAAAKLVDHLRKSKIRSLHLASNKIGYLMASTIGKTFLAQTSLTDLNLSWNCLNDKAVLPIATALKGNNSLRTLNLSSNRFGSKKFSVKTNRTVHLFAIMLQTNKTLPHLDLSDCGLN